MTDDKQGSNNAPNSSEQKIDSKRIHLMPPLLANQIAAGEVVERPASVVKELLENCLDAGATQIHIDLEQSGIDRIRVRDNGAGIMKEDLLLAISRHATSKIIKAADLQAIKSLGFRGEALASIAAVSKIHLASKTAESEHGWGLKYDHSQAEPLIEPISHPQGTTLEISHLFFNVPARRKFLRSDRTELEHIETVVKQIALSRPDVHLLLKHRQSTLLNAKIALNTDQIQQRIASICGQSFMQGALPIHFADHSIKLHGWLGTPDVARSQSDMQYFYVNGRIVRDKVLNHAIRMAYQDKLPDGRYPCYVLYLELPESAVDVNVHPTKHEVRFYESRQIHDFIVFHLNNALRYGITQDQSENNAQENSLFILKEPTATYQSPTSDNKIFSKSVLQYQMQSAPVIPLPLKENAENSNAIRSNSNQSVTNFTQNSPVESKAEIGQPTASFQLIGIFKKTHLLIEVSEELFIISIEKALLAAAYETFLGSTAEKPLIGQPLLFPTHFLLTPKASEILEQKQAYLQRYGILLTQASEQRWLVRELPAELKLMNIELGIKNFIEESGDFHHEEFCMQFIKAIKLADSVNLDNKTQSNLIQTLLSLPHWQKHLFKPAQLIKVF